MEHKPEVLIIYKTYTAAVKASQERYRKKPEHKELLSEISKRYYQKKMQDPAYKIKMREESLARYYRKKYAKEALLK